jgi:hypothetical protein
MTQFFIEFFQRIKSDTPIFFVKLRIAMIVSGIIIIVVQLLLGLGIINSDPFAAKLLGSIFTHSLVVIGTVTGVSFLPTKDPTLISDEVKQAVIKHQIENNLDAIRNAVKDSFIDPSQKN